jgi:hypothetical protein
MIKNACVLLFGYLMLGVTAAGAASAEECSGSITAEEALRAEDSRYAAQTGNDFATMEKLFGAAILTGDADFDVTVKGQELSVRLRFHTVYAKRPGGVQFVSWQATRA